MGSKIMKNVLSVFKINKHGSLAVIIPAKEAREMGITEKSTLTFVRVGNSLHYSPVVIK
jgi:antitoxin component of MazEF toxin-antitoxin module